MERAITIVGGGIGGLSLGILLRREGLPVRLFEAGDYPRHRVCGEFISGRGTGLLQDLICPGEVPTNQSRTVRFFLEGKASLHLKLPEPALCVSRFDLDARLASEFQKAGGELHVRTRWHQSFSEAGVVRATGRRLQEGGFTGLKVHIRDVPLSADLELHFSSAGYTGLCALPDGSTNVCGLFRRGTHFDGARQEPVRTFQKIVGERIYGTPEANSFCSVAGIGIRTPCWDATDEFRLGDSIAVIPPLTGNGMSMALESAFLALPPLRAYSRGEVGWETARAKFSQSCKKTFRRRLCFAATLQKALMQPAMASGFLSCLRTVPGLLRMCFICTR